MVQIINKKNKSANEIISTFGSKNDHILRQLKLNKNSKISEIMLKCINSIKLFSNILDFIPDATFAIDLDGKVIYWNRQMERISGIKSREILGKGNYEYSLPFYSSRRPILIDLAIKYNKKIAKKYIYIKKVGNILTTEANVVIHGTNSRILWGKASPLFDSNNRIVGAVESVRDVTNRRRIEDNLKESEEKFRGIFENTAVGVSLVSPSGRWLKVNKALCKMVGYSEKELLSHAFQELTHPDDYKKTSEFLGGFLTGTKNNGYLEKRYLHKDGHAIWVNINVTLIRNKNNKPLYFVTLTTDITEIRKKEIKLAEARNDFISMSSHQLRTPLSATKWVLETLIDNSNLSEKQKIKVNDLYTSNERLIHLVNNFLNVTQIEAGKIKVDKVPVNIGELINSLVFSLKNLCDKKNKIIKVSIPSKLEKINCDPVITTEIIENLLSNAINYSEKDSKVIHFDVKNRKNDYLISVSNKGYMSMEVSNKVKMFERFVRGTGAKEKEPAGSGLGLYLTKKLLDVTGGRIWFKSNIESGTSFYVTIIKK
jgi:PAS domain S-box-containing protein